jgi:hypothetical protein
VVVLIAFAGHDENLTARTAGIALIGTGLVVGALLAFYAVGLSEDRDRERGGGRDRGEPAGGSGAGPRPRDDGPSPTPPPPVDPHPKPGPRRIGPHRPPPRRRDHG